MSCQERDLCHVEEKSINYDIFIIDEKGLKLVKVQSEEYQKSIIRSKQQSKKKNIFSFDFVSGNLISDQPEYTKIPLIEDAIALNADSAKQHSFTKLARPHELTTSSQPPALNPAGLSQWVTNKKSTKPIIVSRIEKDTKPVHKTYFNSHVYCQNFYNKKPCLSYHYTGKCKFGIKCKYNHCCCHSDHHKLVNAELEGCDGQCVIYHFSCSDIYSTCYAIHCKCFINRKTSIEQRVRKEKIVPPSRNDNDFEFSFPKL